MDIQIQVNEQREKQDQFSVHAEVWSYGNKTTNHSNVRPHERVIQDSLSEPEARTDSIFVHSRDSRQIQKARRNPMCAKTTMTIHMMSSRQENTVRENRWHAQFKWHTLLSLGLSFKKVSRVGTEFVCLAP